MPIRLEDRKPFAVRFWEKVEVGSPEECWPWLNFRDQYGYGRFHVTGGSRGYVAPAHRIAWELLVGPIPEGLAIDHLCRNKACVNPSHLEPVTVAENTRRQNAARPARTVCLKGHPFVEGNILVRTGRGRTWRSCMACERLRERQRIRKPKD